MARGKTGPLDGTFSRVRGRRVNEKEDVEGASIASLLVLLRSSWTRKMPLPNHQQFPARDMSMALHAVISKI